MNRQQVLPTVQDRLAALPRPIAAVFDIGTRAARLMVGPRSISSEPWDRRTFYNDSALTNLGSEVGRFQRKLPVGRSKALDDTCHFLRSRVDTLRGLGVEDDDMTAVGTAVFRWLENRDEVVDYIRRKSGVTVDVLEEEEGRMSLAALHYTHRFFEERAGAAGAPPEYLLLLDQGGGSLEVSWTRVDSLEFATAKSIDVLGTTALRNDFFYFKAPDAADEAQRERVSPEANNNHVRKQQERVQTLIANRIRSQVDFADELANCPVVAYGMGSAITGCFPGVNNFGVHNKTVSTERMAELVADACSEFESRERQWVKTLWAELSTDDRGALDRKLVLVYGLPVYQQVLERFGLSNLRVCGFGLRYGVYLWRYHFGLPLHLPQE